MFSEQVIEINGYEYIARVEFTYYKGSKGSRDSFGVPLEPDEPPSVEIDSVYLDFNSAGAPQILNRAFNKIELPDEVLADLAVNILEEF
jgi:hypothetical protein